MLDENKVIDVLKKCYDPEIPIDLWSLGLIYNIEIIEIKKTSKYEVNIIMTLTTPGCSMGKHMALDIKTKLEEIKLIDRAHVEITFEPEWTPDLMNEDAKIKLGFSQKKEPENISLNLILQSLFMALAAYTRQYYVIFFLYYLFVYSQKLKFIDFI